MNIKNLKPKRNSLYKQGYISPDKCKKLVESVKNEPIIFRSSWERDFIWWCEYSPKVKSWASEAVCFQYSLPDGTQHNYYPDFVVEFVSGNVWCVEIKPYKDTQPPYLDDKVAWARYIKNRCKWDAAIKACSKSNVKFVILTERTIKKLVVL